jgi:hypothetical protein
MERHYSMEAAHETHVPTESFNALVVEGVVHPQGFGWGIDSPINQTVDGTSWTLMIANSHFRVVAEPSPVRVTSSPGEISTAKNEALFRVRACINAIGFHLGTMLEVEITGGYLPPNGILTIQPYWPAVASSQLDGLRIPTEVLEPVTVAALNFWQVRLAVADICQATNSPDDSAYLSYRAIETLRQYYAQETDKTREASWERMRTALGMERSQFTPLEEKAKSRRHGDPVSLTEQDRIDAILLAKTVVSKFIEHLAR